ncbi:hypothetical protein FZEAL_2092 [Fusarium zealandicum]|uniref:Uncharacterized protein n=1 Tax=Fusarium zealandicum TaxID=1053134 RepID=A0A8H4URI0_9HYPO|nr:hypothetical protein FZEAL_2092 [Fusarium zealandicum]
MCAAVLYPSVSTDPGERKDGRRGEIQVSFERLSDSWQPDTNDKKFLDAVKADFSSSLARVNESECLLMPRSDLRLELVEEDVRQLSNIQRTFNLTHKSVATMIQSLVSYRMREIDHSRVQGITNRWVIYIRVRWPLIAGPVAMLLSVIAFATQVIIESRLLRLGTLKSDPLKMLLHGFDGESRDYLRADRNNSKDLDKATVRLAKGVEGPELRLNSSSQ